MSRHEPGRDKLTKFAPKKTGGGDRITENIKDDILATFAPKFAPKETGGGDRITESIKGDRWGSFAPKETVVVVNLVIKNGKNTTRQGQESMFF